MKHLAFSLLVALSVVGCAAEDTTETESEPAAASAAETDPTPAPSTQQTTVSAESIADAKHTIAVCTACGPLPDPWRELSGPLPDPWKGMNTNSADPHK